MNSSQAHLLKSFAYEYIRLAEMIIYFDKDAMDKIDETEKQVEVDRLLGKDKRTPREIQLFFMRNRINLIEKIIASNVGAQKTIRTLTVLMKQHKIERESLKLSYYDGKLLTATQLYVNYVCVVGKMISINAQLNALEERNKKEK